MADELFRDDATDQSARVRSGDSTPLELVDAAIERIEKLNPTLNAVIHRRFEMARDEAKGPLPEGPFRGVPLCIKDSQCRTAGDPYHIGLRPLRDAGYVASHDSQLATYFRKAGFIIVGRTNVPELSSSSTTETKTYGPARNPWNIAFSTGGSSGGSAAAVASGMVPVAHANDTGGSIRMPASCCGLVGMKPSRGRTSFAPDVATWEGQLGEHGVLTRTVRDNAAIMDAIVGTVPGDAYHVPRPGQPFAAALKEKLRPLKVGMRTRLPPMGELAGDAAPECLEAVEFTAQALREIGHDVREVGPSALDDPKLVDGVFPVVGVAIARDLAMFSKLIGRTIEIDELEPFNRMFATVGLETTGLQYLEALENLYLAGQKLESWWSEGWDVLLTPTMGCLPPRIGEMGPDADMKAAIPITSAMGAFTLPFNASGQPAISLPMYRTAAGIPVGIQLVASWGREDLLFGLSAQLETARPWNIPLPM
jgi:amidase